jgi:GNAT superfamily N-acetyltransferase
MTDADVEAVRAVDLAAFADLDRRHGAYPAPPPPVDVAHRRLRRVLATDPEGAWVAERDGTVVGCALAIVREGVWGLSLFVVHPEAQGAGVGRGLLARAYEYGRGARGRVVLSSKDPRALASYARLGLALHPCVMAVGRPRGLAVPPDVRPGSPQEDRPLLDAVDRAVRGAAHGDDIAVLAQGGRRLLVAPGRGYAVVDGRMVRLLAAFDEDGARDLLRAALASPDGGEAMVEWISAAQNWAVGVCLEAGLSLVPSSGAVFLDGDVGPFAPYLPSGAYL